MRSLPPVSPRLYLILAALWALLALLWFFRIRSPLVGGIYLCGSLIHLAGAWRSKRYKKQ